ncbi:helix-turn-helix transcriptional regulator [Streptomyces sp. NPDC097941]|uniref:helix-turn-helix domain-containing protein n=1 Tax=Streptomyces sp. NPDC097941 TaxID=3155685 RepID=UPI00331681C7
MAETRRHSERGPVGDQVAENIRRLRRKTTEQLAGEVSELGVPMTASTVTKIEKQGRRVTVDELVALAAALGVSPVTLMLPSEDPDGPIRLAERLTSTDWRTAWRWMHGQTNFVARLWPGGGGSPLSWLAVNRPYLTPQEVQEEMQRYAQPAPLSVEALQEAQGDEDDGNSR